MPGDASRSEDPAVRFWVSKFQKVLRLLNLLLCLWPNCLLLGSVEILLMLALFFETFPLPA